MKTKKTRVIHLFEPADDRGPHGLRRSGELKLNLLENGIDFIREGIEDFFSEDWPHASAHKYAVLHIFAGVLLLLKERLRLAHPALMFSKVEEMGHQGATTVNFDQAVKRLTCCVGVRLSHKDLAALRAGQKTRNELEHYRISIKLSEAQEVVGNLCEFVFVFLKEQLSTDLASHIDSDVWRRVGELRGIAKKLEAERRIEWEKRANTYIKMSAADLRRLWKERPQCEPKDNPDVPAPLWCSHCGEERVLLIDRGDIAVCTNPECGDVVLAGRCLRCGEVIFGESEGFCDNCNAYMSSDD
jgi:hypothetical protein